MAGDFFEGRKLKAGTARSAARHGAACARRVRLAAACLGLLLMPLAGGAADPAAATVAPAQRESAPAIIQVAEGPVLYRNTGDPAYAQRKFQGIPSIARSGARFWAVWYGGGKTEEPGNFAVLAYSDDQCRTWTEYGYLTFPGDPTRRVYDPQVWTDPAGTLWVLFAASGGSKVHDGTEGAWAITASQPATAPQWSKAFRLSYYGIPMRPAQIGDKVYLPIDYWSRAARPPLYPELTGKRIFRLDYRQRQVHYLSTLGTSIQTPGVDETNLAQLRNGDILAAYRTSGATEYSISRDGGLTWTPSAIWSALGPNPASRIALTNSPSGRLVVAYNNAASRSALTLKLSEDGGKSFPYAVLLEGNGHTSYPEIAFGEGGDIFVIYDNRGSGRSILVARVNEAEVIAGSAEPLHYTVSGK